MDTAALLSRIQSKPDVCHGQACIAGTRIPVTVILDNLAQGMEKQAILDEYPSLAAIDIDASLAYAALLAREHHVAI